MQNIKPLKDNVLTCAVCYSALNGPGGARHHRPTGAAGGGRRRKTGGRRKVNVKKRPKEF